ncbi:retinol dehydrogenase 10 isoform X3 [Pogona vitticeps]|uniref:Retinol dehydrogenase 10-like isoform X3 n=1 Tax=Pogona vitticeps TaxID=103695 RepID=A0ABM5G5Q3_9SAUR
MMAVVVDFFILTVQVFGHILHALIQWVKKPREKLVRNNICLITGAASANGIGRLFALEFARRGAILVLWDVDAEGNESTAQEVRKLGAKAYTYTCDTVKAFLPQMIKRGHGHIVTIAGSLGLFATGYLEDYCASQFAVVGFHEALSHELKVKRIDSVKTTLVCPYFIDTGMFHGCGIRQELEGLLSPLKPDHFVKTAVQGILRNQHMICIPRVIYFVAISKNFTNAGTENLCRLLHRQQASLLPWDVQVLIQNFLGLDKCIPQKATYHHSAARRC